MLAQSTHPLPFDHWRRPSLLMRAIALAWPLIDRLAVARSETVPMITPMVHATEAGSAAKVSADVLKQFQRTIVPHLDSAYNFARFLSRDTDAAGDIVQEAFLRAYRSYADYRGGDARAWVFAIVRNCYRAWLSESRRKSRFEVPMAVDGTPSDAEPQAYQIASEADTPEAATIQKDQSARVRAVIAQLAEPMREILVLRELEDLSYRQIAEIIDAPMGTVMSRLARARADFGEAWRALENGGAVQ